MTNKKYVVELTLKEREGLRSNAKRNLTSLPHPEKRAWKGVR